MLDSFTSVCPTSCTNILKMKWHCNDFTYCLWLCCCWKFFSLVITADEQTFKALVMVELLDLEEEEEETKGRGMTRSWLKKREELSYFKNTVRELQLEDPEAFIEMMKMDFSYLNVTQRNVIWTQRFFGTLSDRVLL